MWQSSRDFVRKKSEQIEIYSCVAWSDAISRRQEEFAHCVEFGWTRIYPDHFESNIWWAFSSTTTKLSVATSSPFFSNSGHRVLFQISSSAARDVRNYSAIPTIIVREKTVYFLPRTNQCVYICI